MIQLNELVSLIFKVINGCRKCIHRVNRSLPSFYQFHSLFFVFLYRWNRTRSPITETLDVNYHLLISQKFLPCSSVNIVEPSWSLTQPNQSTTTLTNISNISTDDSMVNCISQPIKLDDLILITEPRPLTEMGEVS